MQRRRRNITKCRNLARIGRICLECAAIFSHLPLTIRCRLGDYTRAMMIKRILTICAAAGCLAAAAGARSRWRSRAIRRPRARSIRPRRPGCLSAGGYPADYRRGPRPPDFDALDDDEGPNGSSTALPPPGPVLSPDDPRYGRPMGAPPVYSDRGVPTGPVLSPDDPRYGRPAGPPPVIYSDRPGGDAATDLFGPRQRRQSRSRIRLHLSRRRQSRLASARGCRGSDRSHRCDAAAAGARWQADGAVGAAAG